MKSIRKVLLALVVLFFVPSLLAFDGVFASPANEQEWVVDAIGRDLTEIVLYAASLNKDGSGGKPVSLDQINFETKEIAGGSDSAKTADPAGESDTDKKSGERSYQFTLSEPIACQSESFALKEGPYAASNYSPWLEKLISQCKLKPESEASFDPDTSGSAGKEEAGAATKESGVAAKEAGSVTKETGAAAKEAGSAAKESGAATKESGAVTKETGAAAKETDSVTKETGAATKETGSGTKDVSADSKDAGEALIDKLSDFTEDRLAQENRRISKGLSEHPLDASLNEQAALLDSLYGLRECAACFTDVRPWMNRAATHLALAAVLRGKDQAKASTCSKLANTTLLALCNRQSDSLKEADAVLTSSPSESAKSWARAIKIRVTRDYRLAELKKAKLVEQLEHARAMADDLGSDELSDFIAKEKIKPTQAIDWVRIGLRGLSSVESGHRFAMPSLALEMSSFIQDSVEYKGGAIKSEAQMAKELSLRPTRCLIKDPDWHLQVLSWGDISDFHARHVLDSLYQTYNFFLNMWGVKEHAEGLIQHAGGTFGSVRLYPLCQLNFAAAEPKNVDRDVADAIKQLIVDHPEDVNCDLWQLARHHSPAPNLIPSADGWFSPCLIQGTAYDFKYRCALPRFDHSFANLDRLKEIAPLDPHVCYQWALSKYGKKPTGDQLTEAYGALADYDSGVMSSIAYAFEKDPVKHAQALEKLAKYKPYWYFELGDLYVAQKEPEKAKVAYENAVALGRDPVGMANKCEWLVNYYYEHGEKAKALKLAGEAAEVYSALGLLTMARLCERMGNLAEAEKYFSQESERYDDPSDLCQFYMRNEKKNPKYKAAADVAIRKVFPRGLEKVTLADFKEPPSKGARINSNSALLKKAGLKVGDVFVAVNGYRVESFEQYAFARRFGPESDMQFIVFADGKYREFKMGLPERRWSCEMGDYKGASSK